MIEIVNMKALLLLMILFPTLALFGPAPFPPNFKTAIPKLAAAYPLALPG